MALRDEVGRRIAAFVTGQTSLNQLREWFEPLSWQLAEILGDADMPSADQQLVFDVDLLLSEYTSGHRDEQEVRSALLPRVATYRAVLGSGAVARPLWVGNARTTQLEAFVYA